MINKAKALGEAGNQLHQRRYYGIWYFFFKNIYSNLNKNDTFSTIALVKYLAGKKLISKYYTMFASNFHHHKSIVFYFA